jgi:hypothetical protein
MLVVGFRSCVNYEVKWWLGFESCSYIKVKVTTILKLGLKWCLLMLGLRW